MTMLPKKRRPTHPGEILRKDFLEPLGLSQREVAERLGVSYVRFNELVNGRRGVTPDTALRLARLFGTTPEFWLNGQRNLDLWLAMNSSESAKIEAIDPLVA
jgi:addiction module HigA family antidote